MPTSYTYHKSIICVCQFLYWNIYKFYILRSLPQFLISVILACPESFPESFRDRKDSRQAGMTLKTNIQFLTPLRSLPQGIYILSLGDLEIATNNILSPVEKCFVKCHCPSEIL